MHSIKEVFKAVAIGALFLDLSGCANLPDCNKAEGECDDKSGHYIEYDYYGTGELYSKTWKKDGVTTRNSGPARIIYNREQNVIRKSWYSEGQLHRRGGPATIEYDRDTGNAVEETWYKKGLIHRDRGPARIRYDKNTGQLYAKLWYKDDKLHRNGAPAIISEELNTYRYVWYKNGLEHRVGGPSNQSFDVKSGRKSFERWSLKGKWHRQDGPSSILYSNDAQGECAYLQWYENGRQVEPMVQYNAIRECSFSK